MSLSSGSRIVRFVENPELESITNFLCDRPMGSVILSGRLELFQIESKSMPTAKPPSGTPFDNEKLVPKSIFGSLLPRGRSDSGMTETSETAIFDSYYPKSSSKQKLSANSSTLPTATTTPATSLGTSPSVPSAALASSMQFSTASSKVFRQTSDPQDWTLGNRRPRSNSAQLASVSSLNNKVVINGKSKIIVGSSAQPLQSVQAPTRYNRKRSSSLSDLNENSSKQTLADIINVLNESFPDHDFSNVRSKQIVERDVVSAMQVVNAYLSELSTPPQSQGNLLEKVWKQADDAINLRRCDVYSYITDNEGDPFSSGSVWAFNYFFFNRELKRICFFHCIASSKYGRRLSASLASNDDLGHAAETEESDVLHSEDEEEDDEDKKRLALSYLEDEESEDEFNEAF